MNNTSSRITDAPDVIIVGSGVAGALLADQLAIKGFSVLILEAGKQISRQEIVSRYRNSWKRGIHAYERQPHASFPDPESEDPYIQVKGNSPYWLNYLKVVGGTTWHWTGATPRFLPSDFDLHSRYGVGKDWPIYYEDIEPNYLQAEQEMGISGDSNDDHGSPRSGPYPMPPIAMTYSDQVISHHLEKYGFKVNVSPAARNSRPYKDRPACCGNNSCTPICPIGAQYSADTHINSAVKNGAILKENAVVYNVNVNSKGSINSLDYKSPDGQSHNMQGRYYVLACNGIETPKLLLISTSENTPDGVTNSSGLVGKGYMDHPAVGTSFLMSEPLFPGRGPQTVSLFGHGRDGDFRSQHAAGKLYLTNTADVQAYVTKLIEEDQDWESLDSRVEDYAIRYGFMGVELEQLPDLNNRVEPSSTQFDTIGIPKPEIHMEYDSYLKKGGEYFINLQSKLIDYLKAEKIEVFEVGTALLPNHPMGTTCMGSDAASSVVDTNCRSHDHPNLFIAGSSVFTTGGTANPTLTIAALSLRLADYLKSIIQKEDV